MRRVLTELQTVWWHIHAQSLITSCEQLTFLPGFRWGLINFEDALVAACIYPAQILMRLCKVSLSNTVSVSEPV